MNIKISSLHFKADQKLEAFITEKIEKLSKVYYSIVGAEVILKIENNDTPVNKTAEIRVIIRGNDALSSKTAKSFEEATDASIEALKKQLTKIKEKERDSKGKATPL